MQDPTTEGSDMMGSPITKELLSEEEIVQETDTLNAHDRCDSCQSQAYVWVNGITGDLLFCGHHFTKHEDKIRSYAFEIIDERHKLSIKRESSAANAD
jgi:hypothetical protein